LLSPHILRLFHTGVPQILLNLPHIILSKLLLRILRAHTRRYNNIFARIPVNRRGNTLLIRKLQRINDPQHLACVPSSRGGVGHSQPDLLGGVDDEDRSNRKCDAAVLGKIVEVVLRNHVVQESNVAVGIGYDGEGDVGVSHFVDVFNPAVVRGQIVCALRAC
jgi:hypothetical protein